MIFYLKNWKTDFKIFPATRFPKFFHIIWSFKLNNACVQYASLIWHIFFSNTNNSRDIQVTLVLSAPLHICIYEYKENLKKDPFQIYKKIDFRQIHFHPLYMLTHIFSYIDMDLHIQTEVNNNIEKGHLWIKKCKKKSIIEIQKINFHIMANQHDIRKKEKRGENSNIKF